MINPTEIKEKNTIPYTGRNNVKEEKRNRKKSIQK